MYPYTPDPISVYIRVQPGVNLGSTYTAPYLVPEAEELPNAGGDLEAGAYTRQLLSST